MKKPKLSLIICTRNRVSLLKNLLSSIVNSQSQPHEIIIVSSGELIYELVNQYSSLLRIKHMHTEIVGQSNQKKLAFNLLDDDSNWVFFLDDDLELMPKTLTHAFLRIQQVQNNNINGIGTRLIDKSSKFQELQVKQSNPRRQIGKINPSGRVSKYAFNSITYTEWLNGASIWRKDCLNQYILPILNSKYAAYEDVIFSSNVSQNSQLIYDPEIKVFEQLSHANIKLNFSQFKYISLWTGYFVCLRPETRIISYKCLTTFRAVSFLLTGGFSQIMQTRKLKVFLKFFHQIISLPMNKPKSRAIIIGLLEFESNES